MFPHAHVREAATLLDRIAACDAVLANPPEPGRLGLPDATLVVPWFDCDGNANRSFALAYGTAAGLVRVLRDDAAARLRALGVEPPPMPEPAP